MSVMDCVIVNVNCQSDETKEDFNRNETSMHVNSRKGDHAACHSYCSYKCVAMVSTVILGLAVGMGIMTWLHHNGHLGQRLSLPNRMTGRIHVTALGTQRRASYTIQTDFDRKVFQMTIGVMQSDSSRTRRGSPPSDWNPGLNKVIVQDYNNHVQYFIISGNNSTTKCFKQALKGSMLPRDVISRAKELQSQVSLQHANVTHGKYRFVDGSELTVVRLSQDGTLANEVVISTSNASVTLQAAESDGDVTLFDPTTMECFALNDDQTVEEAFYSSTQINVIGLNDGNIEQQIAVMREAVAASTGKDSALLRMVSNKTADGRSRRGILDSLSRWSHGNWCGGKTGGYVNHCAVQGVCSEPYGTISKECRSCNPPVDAIDGVCMEHDRCLKAVGPGPPACHPQGNRCMCDYRLVWDSYARWGECQRKGDSTCALAAAKVFVFFVSGLSCWFPTEVCFPTLRFSCGCSSCSCPTLKTEWNCIDIRFCAPFGSGKVNR